MISVLQNNSPVCVHLVNFLTIVFDCKKYIIIKAP